MKIISKKVQWSGMEQCRVVVDVTNIHGNVCFQYLCKWWMQPSCSIAIPKCYQNSKMLVEFTLLFYMTFPYFVT